MTALKFRDWVPHACETRVQDIANGASQRGIAGNASYIDALIARNRSIHDDECFNLNPATNVMNPKAEAALAAGLGSRPSLGYPGDKYEMGLEAIEEIEVIAAELSAELFAAAYAEVRIASGAMANLYAFMACCKPGDAIIAPPASIGGHVTHHQGGCAGLYGLEIHTSPVDDTGYTVDLDQLRDMTRRIEPKLITIGGSLNLFPHPVREIRAIADEAGAFVLFDAAHQCGIIAGANWPNPLAEGAHMMTMSTYKSLGGPAGGLLLTNEASLAKRIDAIAFPGMTANFDAGKTAALAITMLDWLEFGEAYATAMVDTAKAMAQALANLNVPVFATENGMTQSHQFAIQAASYGGGQTVSKKLRQSGFLACGIGLPIEPVEGDMNGLRMGTPELVRRGVGMQHIGQIAGLIARSLTTNNPAEMAGEVAALRRQFNQMHFIRQ